MEKIKCSISVYIVAAEKEGAYVSHREKFTGSIPELTKKIEASYPNAEKIIIFTDKRSAENAAMRLAAGWPLYL